MLFHKPSSLSVIIFSVSQKTHFDCSTAHSAHAIPNFYLPFPTYENELSSCIPLPRPGIFSCRVFFPVSWALPAITFSCGRGFRSRYNSPGSTLILRTKKDPAGNRVFYIASRRLSCKPLAYIKFILVDILLHGESLVNIVIYELSALHADYAVALSFDQKVYGTSAHDGSIHTVDRCR